MRLIATQIVITATLLLSLGMSAPSLRLEARPRMGFTPKQIDIKVYLTGEERELAVALYEGDLLVTSSSQDLEGDKIVNLTFRRPPPGDLTLLAITADHEGRRKTATLDLHYF